MTRAAGAAYEQRACADLGRAGLELVARNYTTRHGELDLVMLDRDTLVFIEVRYRRQATHGRAADTVTAAKQRKLIQAAQLWLSEHPAHANRTCRFDVISYDGHSAMQWLKRAFEAG